MADLSGCCCGVFYGVWVMDWKKSDMCCDGDRLLAAYLTWL